ncbi:MAG: 50S ribosomal protein L32 [Fusobacteria bacterium]|jgi:large subunit ribosomal protein L32|nr:50S ribosomal protein L32 [Fusobacteriota bacterium]
MAVPKKKTSKAKKNMRRSHHAISAVNVVACPECGETKMPHRACLACGVYNGRQVLEKEGASETTAEDKTEA